MPALEVSDLVVRYGDIVAVDGVGFTADHGSVVALLGPNGAGKTSTVETLEGYRRPAAGTVRVLGLDPVRDARAVRPRIGVMLQSGGVYPGMTAEEAVRLFASYYDDPLDPATLLERVGLSSGTRTPWRRLSGGEQQRLNLALALVGRPKVAFLDEPTAGVDPQGRLAIRDVIRALRDDGATVLLATHDLDETERVADHVVVIDRGKVVADGPAATLAGRGTAETRFRSRPGLDTASLAAQAGAVVTEERPGEYVVHGDSSASSIATLTAWMAAHDVPLLDLRVARETLEDVFLRLTSERSTAEA